MTYCNGLHRRMVAGIPSLPDFSNLHLMGSKTSSRKLLLVDDDADDRRFFMEAVQELDPNIQCVTANNGQQALEILTDKGGRLPDYIFLDLRMPKVNGRQCLLQLKSNERLKKIPVIIYTTSREVEESEELQALGAVHFVTKPSNPDEIYYILSLVLEEQGPA